MEIIPALEEVDLSLFQDRLAQLSPFASRVQIDINDGSFADFRTLTSDSIATVINNYSSLSLEAHLMVQDPLAAITILKDTGISRFLLQAEISADLRAIFETCQSEEITLGLAVGPETSISDIEPFCDYVRFINIMTIPTGKQGQAFLPENLEKITDLHNQNYPGEIEVDGGINPQTIDQIISFSPDTLVVGSFLWQDRNPKEQYELLQMKLPKA